VNKNTPPTYVISSYAILDTKFLKKKKKKRRRRRRRRRRKKKNEK
jgi:hypothetical protein